MNLHLHFIHLLCLDNGYFYYCHKIHIDICSKNNNLKSKYYYLIEYCERRCAIRKIFHGQLPKRLISYKIHPSVPCSLRCSYRHVIQIIHEYFNAFY